ncbi:hypothetical protein GF376_02660 [Candidatus Peregrinibacteria bacterium]|nr:hypothetical protein [Candidatus Peregrinibacteria bacterium]
MSKKNNNTQSFSEIAERYIDAASAYQNKLPTGQPAPTKELENELELSDNEDDQIIELTRLAIRFEAKVPQLIAAKSSLERSGSRLVLDPCYKTEFDRGLVANGFLRPQDRMPLNTIAARAQEVLSSKYERNPDAKVSEIIIDPEKLTDTLLINFGLEPAPARAHKIRKLEYKAQAEVIEGVRTVLQSLQPLFALGTSRGKSIRLYKVSDGKNKGKILYSRKQKGKTPIFSLVDIYSAERQVQGINREYLEDKSQLEKIKIKLEEIKKFFKEKRKELSLEISSGDKGPMTEEYLGLINDCLEILGNVENDLKSNLRKKLQELLKLEREFKKRSRYKRIKGKKVMISPEGIEKRPGLNQNLPILASIPNSIEKINNEIDQIQTNIQGSDRADIEELANYQELPFRELDKMILSKAHWVDLEMADNSDDKTKLMQKYSKSFDDNLLKPLLVAQRSEKLLYPFDKFAQALIDEGNKAVEICKTNDSSKFDEMKNVIIRIYVISKLKRFYSRFDSFYAKNISSINDSINFESAIFELNILKTLFKKKYVFVNESTPEYDESYAKIYETIDIILAELAAAKKIANQYGAFYSFNAKADDSNEKMKADFRKINSKLAKIKRTYKALDYNKLLRFGIS